MVAAWDLGLDVVGATIVPDDATDALGSVGIRFDERVRYADWVDEHGYLYAHLVALYAGIVASEIYTGQTMTDAEVQVEAYSPGSDHYRASYFTLELGGPDMRAQGAVDTDAQRHAANLMHLNWARVKAVADVLMERETLNEAECRQVLE